MELISALCILALFVYAHRRIVAVRPVETGRPERSLRPRPCRASRADQLFCAHSVIHFWIVAVSVSESLSPPPCELPPFPLARSTLAAGFVVSTKGWTAA